MLSTFEEAIVRTLLYADLFDYPLTNEEIWKRLIKLQITNDKLSRLSGISQTAGQIKLINSKILRNIDNYYFLKGKEKIVEIRKKRERWSAEKIEIAKKVVNFLRLIPTIKLIGVSGGLAIGNAGEDDDIDLFIVTCGDLLWTTRLLTTLLVELIGKRRHPGDRLVKNKICLNFFIDENHLAVPKRERDLFSAHEVIQMKPLYDKDGTYQRFLKANSWVKRYLPNAIRTAIKTEELAKPFSNFLERFLKSFQLWYMKKKRTTEVIKEGIIRFHPQDARGWILAKYRQRIKRYKKIHPQSFFIIPNS